jgi:hypothetical protein
MDLYRIYIDEVGVHDLKHVRKPNQRFLSLTGVIFESNHYRNTVIPELDGIKDLVFQQDPDEPIILHRRDIIKTRGPFKVLKDTKIRSEFDDLILIKLQEWDYQVITVVIDKLEHKEKYDIWRYHPYHYCLEILVERFILFLKNINCRGDVMIESRGGKEDKKLKDSFSRLYHYGTDFIKESNFKYYLTSKKLKVKTKSSNIAGLQIADIIAYPSRRGILKEKGLIEVDDITFSEKIIKVVEDHKYLRNEKTGKIWGYGKKILP